MASRSFSDLKRALSPDGIIIPNSGHGGMSYVFKAYLMSSFSKKGAGMYLATPSGKTLAVLKDMIEAGKIKPVIDKVFPMAQAKEAFLYLEENHARGKTVITM